MRRAYGLSLVAAVLLCWTSSRPDSAVGDISQDKVLDEVRTSFTVDGKPIPPEIFREFGDGDLADSGSIWVTVDAQAAVGSNLYADPIKVDGAWVTQTKPVDKTMNGQEATSYKLIGATRNKLLVLIATYNGGGSGTFFTLHIVDVSGQAAFDTEGALYRRVNITAIRAAALGDRWAGDIAIVGDEISVRTSRTGPADDSGTAKTIRIEAKRP